MLVLLGRYDEAIPLLDRPLVINPLEAAAWTTKGEAFYHLGREDEALALLERARGVIRENWAADKSVDHLDRHATAAWTYTGKTLTRLARYDEALAAFH